LPPGLTTTQVGWIAAIVLLLKSQIGLGVLSVPAAFNTLGLAPGIILLLFVATVTTWTGYVIGTFKLNHPTVYGIDDAGQIMFGRIGREFLATAFCLYWLFVSGSAMLGVSIGLNAVSTHGTCTAVFVAVAAIIGLAFASVRTLGRMSWLAWVGTTCVLVSSKSYKGKPRVLRES
jgi:amino acid permease